MAAACADGRCCARVCICVYHACVRRPVSYVLCARKPGSVPLIVLVGGQPAAAAGGVCDHVAFDVAAGCPGAQRPLASMCVCCGWARMALMCVLHSLTAVSCRKALRCCARRATPNACTCARAAAADQLGSRVTMRVECAAWHGQAEVAQHNAAELMCWSRDPTCSYALGTSSCELLLCCMWCRVRRCWLLTVPFSCLPLMRRYYLHCFAVDANVPSCNDTHAHAGSTSPCLLHAMPHSRCLAAPPLLLRACVSSSSGAWRGRVSATRGHVRS